MFGFVLRDDQRPGGISDSGWEAPIRTVRCVPSAERVGIAGRDGSIPSLAG